MADAPEFEPVFEEGRKRPWRINVPAKISETGRRKREYFASKRQADLRVKELQKLMVEEPSSTPELVAALRPYDVQLCDAVQFYLRLQDAYGEALASHDASFGEAIEFFLRHQELKNLSREFVAAFEEFEEFKADRRERTRQDYGQVKTRMRKHFEGINLRDIEPRQVEDAFSLECPTAHGRRRYMRVMKAFFNWAIRRDYLEENPIRKLDPPEIRSGRKQVMTNKEVSDLLTHCRDDMLPYYLFGIFCGIRPKELQRLGWEHVNFDERHIHVPGDASKTWDHRYVDLSENLMLWLQPYRLYRSGTIAPANLYEKHRESYREAGIERWPEDVMRHTFASNHLAKFNDLNLLLRLMGHRSNPQTLWRHYHNARTTRQAEEFWAIRPADTELIAMRRPAAQSS